MKKELLTSVIYQVYTRNFTKEGTFKALIKKLDYLKELGVDILYLLPISPIGLIARKGKLGSPYSIQNYLKINDELGSETDFVNLIKETHDKRMKLMIDIVFNHTSRDSWIKENHPEWMYRNKENKFANKAGDWSDVYDLDLANEELINYLVGVIEHYCELGVDGFRFDVASLLTANFYIKLKKMLNEKYPNTILLAESVHPGFVNFLRSNGYNALSDAELYIYGFDLEYTYSSFDFLKDYLINDDKNALSQFKLALFNEEANNPRGALKIRGYENHDQKRFVEYISDQKLIHSLMALPVFMKGPMFIYNGLETKTDHCLNLFDKDPINWEIDTEQYSFLTKLIKYKKEKFNNNLLTSIPALADGEYIFIQNNYQDGKKAFGFFPLNKRGYTAIINDLPNGKYKDYLSNNVIEIKNHQLKSDCPLYLFPYAHSYF